ncbi:MAG: ABC transporter permease [Ideonella sp.]|nr:ABC transporter permease [Ideonella sp.]
MWPRLEVRAEASRRMRVLSPLLAAGLTLVGGLVLFAALKQNPLHALWVYFVLPVADLYGVSELLLKATPLMLIGIGLAAGYRASVWNIGAEGQFIVGAVFATGIALHVGSERAAWAVPAMVVAGAAGGALWAAIPAWLRTRFGTNEILVSLMLVYVAQLLASWLIHGRWKDPGGYNFPQTATFGDSALLPLLIEGTRLNAGFLLALALLVAGHVFLQMSFQGFQLQVAGQAPDAGRYAGFSARRAVWVGMLAGGALAGIAGMTEVAGPMGQLTSQISAGYGFAAIIVAFVGRLQPLGVFFASLLMALLFLGGEQAQQQLNLPSSISKVFQGMLLFFLLACDLFIGYRLRFGRTAPQGA